MINSGYIMLDRNIIDWEWYSDVNTSHLFIHCLIKANYSQKKWRGEIINKGEFITSYERLSVETGLTVQKVRTALKKLIDTNFITLKSDNKFSKISISNLNDFLVDAQIINFNTQNNTQNNKHSNNQITNKQQTSNNQITTTKTKEEKEKRKEKFREKVFAHSKYNQKILNSFFTYWTEFNKKTGKMRFEKDGFFEIENRLEKWLQNEKNENILISKNELLTNR